MKDDEKNNESSKDIFEEIGKKVKEESIENNETPNKLSKKDKKENIEVNKVSGSVIALGYVLTLITGVFGFIIAIYLLTRDDKRARTHGIIMIIIFAIWLIIMIWVAYNTGYYNGHSLADDYLRVGYNRGYDAGFIDGWNGDYYKGTGRVVNNTIYNY